MKLDRINKIIIISGFLCVVLIMAIGFFIYINAFSGDFNKKEINLGISLQPANGLVIVAWKKGFFEEEGLKINYILFPSGKRCLLYGLLPGKVDIATTSDIPYVMLGFKRNDLKVMYVIGKTASSKEIIVRKDHGIECLSDLKGKTIATQKDSAVHYYLSMFLMHNMINPRDVNIKFMNAEELPEALIDGKIDGFCMRPPYTGIAERALGENALIFKQNNIANTYDILTYMEDDDLISIGVEHKIELALYKAEKFIKNNPAEALNIISKAVGANIKELKNSWRYYQYMIIDKDSFDFDLENKTKWVIRQHLDSGERKDDDLSKLKFLDSKL